MPQPPVPHHLQPLPTASAAFDEAWAAVDAAHAELDRAVSFRDAQVRTATADWTGVFGRRFATVHDPHLGLLADEARALLRAQREQLRLAHEAILDENASRRVRRDAFVEDWWTRRHAGSGP